MKKKYLPLYEKWMTTGKMKIKSNTKTNGGLCSTSIGKDVKSLFAPIEGLDKEFNNIDGYWGCGEDYCPVEVMVMGFTPLRQTIVLFMAAMNDEL